MRENQREGRREREKPPKRIVGGNGEREREKRRAAGSRVSEDVWIGVMGREQTGENARVKGKICVHNIKQGTQKSARRRSAWEGCRHDENHLLRLADPAAFFPEAT